MKVAPWFIAALALSSCAEPHASGVYETRAPYKTLYAASLSSVYQVGYTVTSSSPKDGMIIAQQGVLMGNGSVNGLNVSVSDGGGVRHLIVNFQAPPATLALGSFDQNVTQYVSAVRGWVPDLRPAVQ